MKVKETRDRPVNGGLINLKPFLLSYLQVIKDIILLIRIEGKSDLSSIVISPQILENKERKQRRLKENAEL